MDAKTVFREGITAIRANDPKRGRDLLMRALKMDPNNEVAWLWLSRTVDDRDRKIQCLERALQINPANLKTKTLIEKIKNASTDVRISTAEITRVESASSDETLAPAPTPTTVPGTSTVLKKSASSSLTADESKAIAKPVTKAGPAREQIQPFDAPAMVRTPPPFSAPVEEPGETITQTYSDNSAWLDEPIDSLTPMLPENSAPNVTTVPPFAFPDDEPETIAPSQPDNTNPEWLSEPVTPVAAQSAPKRTKAAVPADKAQVIKALMKKAQAALEKDQIEKAIDQWVEVLEIEVDHIEALGNAVRYLSRLKYLDDARELTWNAINAGTTHPSVYITAIGIADHQGNPGEADDLRLKLVQLPEANEQIVIKTVDHFLKQSMTSQAVQALDYALPLHPKSQKLLIQRAQIAQDMEQPKQALHFYELAAQLGTRTPEGKLADEQLLKFAPRLSDKERGSMWMAVREAFGFGFVYLLMGWQDAGLNLSQLGPGRLIGVLLSMFGGYLLISATSSPQQRPLAKWLGGTVPERKNQDQAKTAYEQATSEPEDHSELPIIPMPVRITFGLIGIAILIGAFALVFSTAINLLIHPNPTTFHIPTLQELLEEAEQAMR
jgi:tetratricopeptide (TPR) repeat protein